MPTTTDILAKTAALQTKYSGQESLNYVLKVLGDQIANDILRESKPIPPLKKVVDTEFNKAQLILDRQDKNYLLTVAKYNKRRLLAQRSKNGDVTLQETTYRLLIANNPVDVENEQEQLKSFLIALTNQLAEVTLEEENAVIPQDEAL